MAKYNFCGWATKNDLTCSDGRIIRSGAFKHCDGKKVPLCWNHDHTDPYRVVGHAILEHREEGVYAYGYLNDSDLGKTAKIYIEHGDITQMSIYANKLKQQGPNVMHGDIREVSLVLAGANPGACIENVIAHGEEMEEEAVIYVGENFDLKHGEEMETEVEEEDDVVETEPETETEVEEPALEHAESSTKSGDKTIAEIMATLNPEQEEAVAAVVGMAIEDTLAGNVKKSNENNEGGDESMKHNLFEKEVEQQGKTLTHADQENIIALAKSSGCGSLQQAMAEYATANDLQHGIFEDYEELFPEYELLKKGEPETLERDQSWISYVMNKIHKSPVSRIRTRHADARIKELKALGYQNKGDQKKTMAQIKMIGRTTDPQTIYIKDDMHRDDIIDITDFDVVAYQWKMMRHVMDETLALAALIGDGREEGDADKIHETHIRSIYNDEEMYTIHKDVDIEAARKELQGTNTNANFGENYIYAEAIIAAALYAREQYKGTGTPDLFCTPHMVNVMLLARDLNGRRIYDSKADLAAALNVGAIYTIEQFEGVTRTNDDGDVKKLLGLFVNLADYQFGSTKGGQITKFEDFDMDFNKYKYMLETRLSGSLTKLYSAIALEEPVAGESTEG